MPMSWAPNKFSEITPDSLSMFRTVRPVPEILILGCGRHIEPLGPELQPFIRSTGMNLEAIDSKNAVSTYNILNEEGRIVAAAFLRIFWPSLILPLHTTYKQHVLAPSHGWAIRTDVAVVVFPMKV